MEKENNNKKRIMSLIVLCVSIVALSVSITYAYFVSGTPVNNEQALRIDTGTMSLIFRDGSDDLSSLSGTWTLGDIVEKYFEIENNGTLPVYAKISWDNLVNTYLKESLSYTLEEKTDETGSAYKKVSTSKKNVPQSTTSSTQELVNGLLIPAGKTYTYKLTIKFEDLEEIDQTQDINANFSTDFVLEEGTERKPTLADYIETVEKKTTTPNFANAAVTDETADGLYSMIDDSGNLSYYFRGAVENNYVKFGKDKNQNDMFWRIIRINGDGTVRMQYDGTQAYANGVSNTNRLAITSQVWNTQYNDAKYVGYMFGGAQGAASTSKTQAQTNETSSDVKIALENWYKENIVDTGWNEYIADEIFCNDRSTPGADVTGWTSDTGKGFGTNITGYGALSRFLTGNNSTSLTEKLYPTPQFTCPQENDKFTVTSEWEGNGKLTYPVGMITTDEIVVAGSGRYNTSNNKYYLYKGTSYWTFSPRHFSNPSPYAYEFFVNSNGYLYNTNVNNTSGAVAPVINIKVEYLDQFVGTGVIGDEYRLES